MRERVLRCVEELGRFGQGDAFASRSRASSVEYKANVLVGARTSSSAGTGARVVVDGRLGAAGGTNHITPTELVCDAREAAAFGPEVGFLDLPGSVASGSRDVQREADVVSLNSSDLRHLAEAIVDGVLSARPEVLVDVTVSCSETDTTLGNSSGLVHDGSFARLSISAAVKRNRDGDLLRLGSGGSARQLDDARVDPAHIVKDLLTRLDRCDRTATIPPGNYPVVFGGDGVAGVLYPLMLGLGGENLARGTSPLTRAVPRLHPKFTLYSDASLYAGPVPDARDGDGHAERRVDFVREGEIVAGVFDAVTAARFVRRFPERASWAHLGCSRRAGVSGATSPGPAVLAVASGDTTNILEGIRRGLYVESLFGVRMGNPISGEFSNSVYVAYLVEEGEVVGRVKNVMIAGNVYEALARVEAVGHVAEWADDDALFPEVRIGALRVTSKS